MKALEGCAEVEHHEASALQKKVQQLERDLVEKEGQLAQVDECEREIASLRSVIAGIHSESLRETVETQNVAIQVDYRDVRDASVQCMPMLAQTQDVGVQLEICSITDHATQVERSPDTRVRQVGVQAESHSPKQSEDFLPEGEDQMSSDLAVVRKQLALANQRLQIFEELEHKYNVMHQRAQAAERSALEMGLWKRRALETKQQVFTGMLCGVMHRGVSSLVVAGMS